MKVAYRLLYYLLELCVKMAIMLLVFSFLKLLFYGIHHAYFPLTNFDDGLKVFAQGLRFDLSALCYVNTLLIISYLLPLPQRSRGWYQRIQQIIFVFCNGFALLFEIVDIAYFPFVQRRSNAGDMALAGNTSDLMPLFLGEYWYLLVLFVILLFFLYWSFKKWRLPSPAQRPSFWNQCLVMTLGAGLFLIAFRGGVQLRPLMPLNAQKYVPNEQLAPLVYPTILSLIFSTQQKFITEKNYFNENEIDHIFPIHHKNVTKQFRKEKTNIVVIILESFGEEHSGFLSNSENTDTPFLDSLLELSFYYEKSFANGMRSTQGIAAITAGIPALMEDPYIFSAYQNNHLNGIPALLKQNGYYSAFFHGANPGSMDFEDFAYLCGFDVYFDRKDFNDDHYYDGHWGIWDRPFFQYTAQTLDTLTEPFYAQLFSLSSHHPYEVEPGFEALYPKLDPLRRSIRYTDDALRRFFHSAQKMDWFKHSLFIITADHTGYSGHPAYQNRIGRYLIPLLLYSPDSTIIGEQKGIAQQTDILPTIIDYLDTNISFTSFGNSLLDTTTQRYAYMYDNQMYQILDERYILLFDGEATVGLYDYLEDKKLNTNLMTTNPGALFRMEQQMKAALQQHHNSLIRNDLGN